MSAPEGICYDEKGLVPVVAQDANTGEVLMLAYASREAVQKTIETGEAHYHSRSRGELWRKGETSGNTQRVVEVRLDCDGDALLSGSNRRDPPVTPARGAASSPPCKARMKTLRTSVEPLGGCPRP